MEEVRYMISETAKRVGVEAHVLRYWQKQLELPISRNEMDQRYYKDSDIELFKRVKHLMERGFQLKAIKMLLSDIDKADMQDMLMQESILQDLTTADLETTGNTVAGASASGLKLSADHEDGEEQMLYMEENRENTEENIIVTTAENTGEDTNETVSGDAGETSLIMEQTHGLDEGQGSKIDRFGALLNHIISTALKENNDLLSKEISGNVTEGVVREMNYLMRLQEEKEEERYRKFDSTLRDYQKSRMMAAATVDKHKRKKSKFFTKNRVYI